MSVAYRSATVGGRKRMDARDNPKEDEREKERAKRGRNSKAKDRSDLYRALLLDLDLVPLDSRGRVQSSRSSWNLDQKFLWNPMEFSAWSMSLISRWELWFISFWETPTWPRVYYLNFIWDYFGLPSFLVFHGSKIFTIAEIFFDSSVLCCFSTHALALTLLFFNNNNMIFNVLFFKIIPF